MRRRVGRRLLEEKNKKTEGKSANGRGQPWVVVLCSWRLDVLSRGNTSDFQSAPCCGAALPFEPKQTECSVFFAKWPGRTREGGREEETDYVLDFNWKATGRSEREREKRWNGGGDKRKERKKKRRRESSRDHARIKKNFPLLFFVFAAFFLFFFFFLPTYRCNALRFLLRFLFETNNSIDRSILSRESSS